MQAVAILSILVTWAGYAAAFMGLGAWRFIFPHSRTLTEFCESFWCGVATLFALLQIWQFFAPINFTTHLVFTLLGGISFLFIAPGLYRALKSFPRRTLLRVAVASILFMVWLANRATGPNIEYDAGLYHIAAIRWIEAGHVVPGLANLHMRLGFSSTISLLSAFMDQGLWAHQGSHIVNGFFLASFAAMIMRSATRVLANESTEAADWLLIFAAPLVTDWAVNVQVSSYGTDIGTAILSVAAGYYFLRSFTDRAISPMLCTLLACAAISAKPSALILCAPLILIAFLVQQDLKIASIAGATLIIVPWLVRQTVLSGYPLYPYEGLGLPFDWKVPYEKVRWLHRILLDYARWRSYDDTRTHFHWVSPWFRYYIVPRVMHWKCFFPAAIGLGALVVAGIRKTLLLGPVLLLACSLFAIVGWFFSAPDPRYSSQIFILWMSAAVLLVSRNRKFIIVAAVLAIAPLVYGRQLWVSSPPEGLFHQTPSGQYVTIITGTGVHVNVPPSESEDRTWDAPLPSAPRSEIEVKEVNIPALRLRNPSNLQDGFARPTKVP